MPAMLMQKALSRARCLRSELEGVLFALASCCLACYWERREVAVD